MAKKQPKSNRTKPRSRARNAAQDPRWEAFGGRARLRRDPFVRRVTLHWRRLTDGAPTLVACSGGADSLALALALIAVSDEITLAHVTSDLHDKLARSGVSLDKRAEVTIVSVEGESNVPEVLKTALAEGAQVVELTPKRETLEDLFMRRAL